ncbi:glycosyltransferase family 4 protein [Candidatus Woesebacteria bacterium]|nr:glycosyltransferase family 4 protein [Candidatus Woesebacteria bacterium]
MKKALLFEPYLDVMGGGERHVLSIMEVLQENGYAVDIAWDDEKILGDLRTQLHMPLKDFHIVPNVFKPGLGKQRDALTRQYDIFIYVTDGSYFLSNAKKNYIFAMYPDKTLFKLTPLNWLKTRRYQVIANGDFTAERIKSWLKIKTHVLPPYFDKNQFESSSKRSKTIISVGRIFQHLHSKRHDIVIQAFIRLKEKYQECNDFSLDIIGGLKKEDTEYMKSLQKLAEGRKDISFHTNISHKDLKKHYSTALFYWHAGGFGIEENLHPENVEHFGITPIEAMISGCITLCYNAGGPKKYITDGNNGYLYNTIEELVDKTYSAYTHPQKDIIKNAQEYIDSHFSPEVFKNTAKIIFDL